MEGVRSRSCEDGMKGIFSKNLSKYFCRAFELRQTVDYKIIKPVSSNKLQLTPLTLLEDLSEGCAKVR
jgi:two-component SAPR family response regulator